MAEGYLTTHVLDTARGVPAAGMWISLYRLEGEARQLCLRLCTNGDGRSDAPLLSGADFATGVYELVFEAGAYLAAQGPGLPDPPFLDMIPIRFGIADRSVHYHVPLLVSPFGYSTYRGS